VTHRLSNESLYRELKADEDTLRAEGVDALYRIGDCVAPRLIADAIFDGHRLAREIDSENPAVPLPYRRESAALEPVALP
jgi:dimethylamine/trimethylamine dehydrogenase